MTTSKTTLATAVAVMLSLTALASTSAFAQDAAAKTHLARVKSPIFETKLAHSSVLLSPTKAKVALRAW
jgi:hypothetical protein